MSENERKEGEAPGQLPELEVLCPKCGGRGHISEGGDCETCWRCDGAGYEPTHFGKKVLALMRHNFWSMLDKRGRGE